MQGQIVYQELTKNGREIVIRYPKFSDARAMKEYINALSKEKTYVLYQGHQMSLAAEKAFLQARIKDIEAGREVMLLLFVDQKLAGISAVAQKGYAQSPQGDFGISIAKKYRGKGYGKLLMHTVLTQAEALLPVQSIVLSCFSNNTTACQMYKKMGFKEVGRIQQGILHRGKFVDELLFQRSVKK